MSTARPLAACHYCSLLRRCCSGVRPYQGNLAAPPPPQTFAVPLPTPEGLPPPTGYQPASPTRINPCFPPADAPCSGIGKHTAALLAQQGATLLVHGRNRTRVQRTLRELRSHTGNASVYGYCYDMSDLQQTHDFAAHLRRDLFHHFDGRWAGSSQAGRLEGAGQAAHRATAACWQCTPRPAHLFQLWARLPIAGCTAW